MMLFFKFLSRWPLWALQALGWCLGWLTFLASPSYRRRLVANARLAGQAGAVWSSVGQAGCLVAESPKIWWGELPPCEWLGGDVLARAHAKGRGILFLTPHLGCFEMAPQSYAQQFSPQLGPITILYRPSRHAGLEKVLASARQRPFLKTATTTLTGVRQMLKALRAGEAVGLLPDQVPPQGQGVWAPFFGKPAYSMTLAARLAQQTGATVVLAVVERLSWGRGYRIHLSELTQPLAADLDSSVQQINQEMERLIQQHPQQYLWAYNRYKTPRTEA
jgi:KDO2-lipid IV(A) lauroyltransferase